MGVFDIFNLLFQFCVATVFFSYIYPEPYPTYTPLKKLNSNENLHPHIKIDL